MTPPDKLMSPRHLNRLENFYLDLELSQFKENRHLVQREKPYCQMNLTTHGIFVIRETEDGWWRESIDFKGDLSKQIDKLKADSTVACGFINQSRFNEPGGWSDPNG